MMSKRTTHLCATAVACLLAGTALAQTTPTVDAPGQGAQAQPGSSGDADVQAIVDALFAVSGNHARVRASGAKGVCVKGAFTPSPEAPSLSKAPHFARPSR
jgi:catalase